jgi:hypothetical protein
MLSREVRAVSSYDNTKELCIVRKKVGVLCVKSTWYVNLPLCSIGTVQPQPKAVVEFAVYKIMTDIRNIYPLWEISGFHAKYMRSAIFWDVTQCVVAIPYGRFGTTYRSHLQGSRIQDSSVSNSHSALRNIPEERRSHLVDGIFLFICSTRRHVHCSQDCLAHRTVLCVSVCC